MKEFNPDELRAIHEQYMSLMESINRLKETNPSRYASLAYTDIESSLNWFHRETEYYCVNILSE